MPRRQETGFVWIPREKNTRYSIWIDGNDVTSDCVSSEFTSSLIGLDSTCKIQLIDTDGDYSGALVGGEVIELKLDFNDGSTSKWKGTLETTKNKLRDAYIFEAVGSAFQTLLLDMTVTKSYSGDKTADAILKEIIDEFLTGFTYSNVASFTQKPVISWDNKPFWDCVIDLCDVIGADCYVDTNKDFHLFEKETVEITDDAIVWNDNLLEIEQFGADTIEIKNRIIVYGENDDGLPIVYQTDDTSSQAIYGVKEKVIKDTSVKTYNQAVDLAEAELALAQDIENKGIFNCIILPDLVQGGKIWITNPTQHIHGQFRVVQFTYFLPDETCKVVISKDKTIPLIFKERKKAELSLQSITNPYKMKNSIVFNFDDFSELQGYDSNISISDGSLVLSSGTEGIATSTLHTFDSDVTQAYFLIKGEALSTLDVRISTNGGTDYQSLNKNALTNLTNIGNDIMIEIRFHSSNTVINGMSVMLK